MTTTKMRKPKKITSEVTTWETLVARAREIVATSVEGIYDQAQILVELYNREDFKAAKTVEGVDQRVRFINHELCRASNITFDEMSLFLKNYTKEQWVQLGIGALREDYIRKLKEITSKSATTNSHKEAPKNVVGPDKPKKTITRNVRTNEECAAIQKESDGWKRKYEDMKVAHDALAERYKLLEEMCSTLKISQEHSRCRIEMLTKLVGAS